MSAFKGLTPFDPRFWSQLDRMAAICAQQEVALRGTKLVETPSKEVVCMRLTNNLGEGEYEFAEQEPVPGGGWRLKQGGATYAGGGHARSGRCHESNLNARVPVPSMQVGTVKYDSAATPSYRFLNCCQVVPTSGSGASDDPTTTDDGILIKEEVVDWFCIGIDPECYTPVLVKHRYRYEVGAVPRRLAVMVRVLTECSFKPCAPGPGGSGGGSGAPLYDVWRRCNQNMSLPYPQPDDLLLDPSYLAAAARYDFAAPVLQIIGEGPCYRWQGVASGTPTLPDVDILEGCDSEECNNCECDLRCLRIEATKGGNVDWVQYTLLDGEEWCPEEGAGDEERGGDTGGLANPDFLWVANAWEIVVGDLAGTWEGVFRGNDSGCPSGTFTLVEATLGDPPPTISVGTCPCATAMRIAGYVDGMFGQIQRSDPTGDCEDCGSFTANGDDVTGLPTWDGTLTAVAGTEFTIGGGFTYSKKMKISGATETAIREDSGTGTTTILGTDYHTYTHRFKCANLSSLTYRRLKALGKPGEYELYQAGVSADTIACGQPWPQTITLECFTPP